MESYYNMLESTYLWAGHFVILQHILVFMISVIGGLCSFMGCNSNQSGTSMIGTVRDS